jgi:hypothetical protein
MYFSLLSHRNEWSAFGLSSVKVYLGHTINNWSAEITAYYILLLHMLLHHWNMLVILIKDQFLDCNFELS